MRCSQQGGRVNVGASSNLPAGSPCRFGSLVRGVCRRTMGLECDSQCVARRTRGAPRFWPARFGGSTGRCVRTPERSAGCDGSLLACLYGDVRLRATLAGRSKGRKDGLLPSMPGGFIGLARCAKRRLRGAHGSNPRGLLGLLQRATGVLGSLPRGSRRIEGAQVGGVARRDLRRLHWHCFTFPGQTRHAQRQPDEWERGAREHTEVPFPDAAILSFHATPA
ncbi:hypothetical protein RA8CHR_02390 [Variovorax sp. RA8]|nr:hypothetical protein RA8CHR_02390 [Variovorax sp. RA8]